MELLTLCVTIILIFFFFTFIFSGMVDGSKIGVWFVKTFYSVTLYKIENDEIVKILSSTNENLNFDDSTFEISDKTKDIINEVNDYYGYVEAVIYKLENNPEDFKILTFGVSIVDYKSKCLITNDGEIIDPFRPKITKEQRLKLCNLVTNFFKNKKSEFILEQIEKLK